MICTSFYKVPKFLKHCLINPFFSYKLKKIAFCHLHLSDLTFYTSDLPNWWMKLMLHSSSHPVRRLLLQEISSWVSTLPASSMGTKSACSLLPQRHFQRCPLFLNSSNPSPLFNQTTKMRTTSMHRLRSANLL